MYKNSRKHKPIMTESRSVVACNGGCGRGRKEGTFGADGNIQSPGFGDGFVVYTHVKPNQTAHFQHMLFTVCQLHLNNAIVK